jgi:hypothetical protein
VDTALPGSDAPLAGSEVRGGSISSAAAASVGTDRPLSFFGSVTVGGGVSRESMRPIASIAPPSISVRSLIVAELFIELTERVGERSGRLGLCMAWLTTSGRCGEESVLIMVGKALWRDFGDTAFSSIEAPSPRKLDDDRAGLGNSVLKIQRVWLCLAEETYCGRSVLLGGGCGLFEGLGSGSLWLSDDGRDSLSGDSNVSEKRPLNVVGGSVLLLRPFTVSSPSSSSPPILIPNSV